MDTEAASHSELPGNEQKIHSISWNVLGDLIAILANKIRADRSPDIIVGLQRGGLIPAVMLSHRLGIATLLSLAVRSTASDAIAAIKHPPIVTSQDLSHQVSGRDLVVVDDVVGSGATLTAVVHHLQQYRPARIRCATLMVNREQWDVVHKHEPANTILYIGRECFGWVVFPWETGLSSLHP